MFIDLVFVVILVVAVFKGLRNGFIIAVFSLLALVIGLAAAMKLSTYAAQYLAGSTNISARWLPFVSFLLVFLLAIHEIFSGMRLSSSVTSIRIVDFVIS